MHVVHLYDGHERVHGGRGSVPGVVWHVARETAAQGHEVTVVERRWAGLASKAEHEGVGFERLDLRTGADEPWTRVPYEEVRSPVGLTRLAIDRTNFARVARRRLGRLDPDVLHVHLPFAAAVLLSVDRAYRNRTVYTAHLGELRLNLLEGGDVHVPRFLSWFSPDLYLAKRAARTTVLNAEVRSTFERRGVPAARLSVVPNGVDLERFGGVDDEAAWRTRSNRWGDADLALLFVGTVMPRKGVDVLVRAMARLVENGVDARLVVAGEATLDAAYAASVRELVGEEKLVDRVDLLGFVPDDELERLYAAADACVLPSREEGFGMTALEAMAAGTPVVATRVGGLPGLLEDGESGFLVRPDDPAGLAEALAAVAGMDRGRMGAAARARAEAFSWPAVAERFEAVYRAVGGAPAGATGA